MVDNSCDLMKVLKEVLVVHLVACELTEQLDQHLKIWKVLTALLKMKNASCPSTCNLLALYNIGYEFWVYDKVFGMCTHLCYDETCPFGRCIGYLMVFVYKVTQRYRSKILKR